jgi:thioesterase domain-containing protein
VSRSDDFFLLGGDSLLVVRLMLDVERCFGLVLPASALMAARTLGQMACLLDARSTAAPLASLVPLQPSGARRAVFCLHGLDGDVQGYRLFAQALGPQRPVFGLRAQGLDGCAPPHAEVEEMAMFYAAQIRAQQPSGPYIVIGYSLGGWLAYAVAQAQQREGQQIALLGIFDTWQYVRLALPLRLMRRPLDLVQRIHGHAGKLRALNWPQRWSYVVRCLGILAGRIQALFRPLVADGDIALGYSCLSPVLRYAPQPFLGDMTLFVPSQTMAPMSWFWHALVRGRLRIEPVQGEHATMMDRDHAPDLAARVESVLQRVER